MFTLESGFDWTNGKTTNNSLFNRQSVVGLSSRDYGTMTLGRQYDSVVDYLAPISATGSWGGTYFAHYGNADNLNSTFSIKARTTPASP